MNHNIQTGANTICFKTTEQTRLHIWQVKFRVRLYQRQANTELYTFLPYAIAVTILLKESEVNTMPEASLAASLPYRPIDRLTSPIIKFFSPLTTATVLFLSLNPIINAYLSYGLQFAITLRRGSISSNVQPFLTPKGIPSSQHPTPPTRFKNLLPSIIASCSFSLINPHFKAKDLQFSILSSENILTLTPAFLH